MRHTTYKQIGSSSFLHFHQKKKKSNAQLYNFPDTLKKFHTTKMLAKKKNKNTGVFSPKDFNVVCCTKGAPQIAEDTCI